MSRPIKFRAWKNDTMYLPEKGCDLLIRIDGEQYVDIDIEENVGLIHLEKKDHTVLMQFTGMKDKDGKEIYEGDICKFVMESTKDETYEKWQEIGDVRYSVNTTQFILQANDWYGLGWPIEVKVIGNIYENKELLK